MFTSTPPVFRKGLMRSKGIGGAMDFAHAATASVPAG
jgi:hypothetical protein